jgi:hypothetical protein
LILTERQNSSAAAANLEDSHIPSRSTATPVISSAVNTGAHLTTKLRLLALFLLISEHTVPPNWVFALAPFLCISGVFLHYVSDAQASATNFILGFALYGSVYLLPQYLTITQGYDAFETGQTMIWVGYLNC